MKKRERTFDEHSLKNDLTALTSLLTMIEQNCRTWIITLMLSIAIKCSNEIQNHEKFVHCKCKIDSNISNPGVLMWKFWRDLFGLKEICAYMWLWIALLISWQLNFNSEQYKHNLCVCVRSFQNVFTFDTANKPQNVLIP